jgi:cell division protein FtsW (lipid II flippase)
VGFALNDFERSIAGYFWLVAIPAGFLLSIFLGRAHLRRHSERVARDGGIQLAHWIAIPAATTMMMVFSRDPNIAAAQMMLLIVALVYYLAGIHLQRVWLYGSIAMLVGIFLIPVLPGYPFTIVGACVAISLIMGAIAGTARQRKAQTLS